MEYDRSDDPLYRDVKLDHVIELPVLGLHVRFASNAAAVIDIVNSAFSAWSVLDPLPVSGDSLALNVTLIVQPGDEGDERAHVRYRLVGRRVLLATRGSMGLVDPATREATAWVTPAFVADTQHFRYSLVEAVTMALITEFDRQPFHAACLVGNGGALLLTGPSGVGKSSLTWAALQSGRDVRVIAEDTVFLQTDPALRIWGLPGYLHLPADMARLYPELDGLQPTVLNNGKTKLAIDLRSPAMAAMTPFVERAVVCELTRAGNEPGIRRVGRPEMLDRLTGRMEHGFDRFSDTIGRPLNAIVADGGWVMELPAEPTMALPWLFRMLADAAD